MDAFRKQLDALMGANRNGDLQEVDRKYYDREVCRAYLCGLCPHELFTNTKMDLGPCNKLHSPQLRKDYEEAKAKGKDDYDRELEEIIEKIIVECDRKIARALKRLEDDDAGAGQAVPVSMATKTPEAVEITTIIKQKLRECEELELQGRADDKIKLMEEVEELRQKRADKQALALLEAFNKDKNMGIPPPPPVPPPAAPSLAPLPVTPPDARTQEMINEKLKKAEELGEQGLIDEAQRAMEEAEALRKLAASRPGPGAAEPPIRLAGGVDPRVADQKLRVCDICGAFLSIYDRNAMSGMTDHLGGKLHVGYLEVRDKLQEIREARAKPRGDKERDRAVSRDRLEPRSDLKAPGSHMEKAERGEREKSRDRERGDRDRDRRGERDRGDRDRERDRGGRDRDRDRDRDVYDRKRRERSRSRDRDRYRDRGDDRRHSGRYRH